MLCGHVGTAQGETQNKNPDPETLLAADQGQQEKQCEPTRSPLKFTKHATARDGEIYL